MTSPMRFFRKDPMRKGRGAGYYYRRSYKGTTRWLSKYSGKRDGVRKAGIHRNQQWRYAHTADYSAKKTKGAISPRAKKRTILGWF